MFRKLSFEEWNNLLRKIEKKEVLALWTDEEEYDLSCEHSDFIEINKELYPNFEMVTFDGVYYLVLEKR